MTRISKLPTKFGLFTQIDGKKGELYVQTNGAPLVFDNGADALQTQLELDAYLNIKLAIYPMVGK